jgi:hypothetical protein
MQRDHHLDQARQSAELATAEAKALSHDQCAGMDDMADYLEKLHQTHEDRGQALAAGRVQAGLGGRHG